MTVINKKVMSAEREKAISYFSKNPGTKPTRVEAVAAIRKDFENFTQEFVETRKGSEDKDGNPIAGYNISLHKAIEDYYETDKATFLRTMGVYMASMSLEAAGRALGGPKTLSLKDVSDLLKAHTSFANTRNYSPEFEFLIPALIEDAIRIGYEGGGLYRNWIAATQPMGNQNEVTMPHIIIDNTIPGEVGEGATISKGRIKMGQKKAGTKKVGSGFELTYELIRRATLNLMALSLQNVGVNMALGADAEAIKVLINGDQLSGAESAPVIGVTDPTKGFLARDIKRATTRMKRLGFNPDFIVASEEDGLDIADLPEFKGFSGAQVLASLQNILGMPSSMRLDTYVLPESQILVVAQNKALILLESSGMLIEQEKEISNQTVSMYVSDEIGFANARRDGRVIIDRSVAYSAQPFPSWMDVDSIIGHTFKV